MIKTIDYNAISQVYDTSRVANAETTRKLVRLLHINNASNILDMGCGTGNYSAALQPFAKNIIGIDISKGMIEQARKKVPTLEFIHGDITSLPFNTNTFDGAFAIQVLHHIEKKLTFLEEVYRVLRSGACLAIDSCSHQQLRTFWLYYYFPKGLDLDLARIPDCGEIASLLERAGFSNVSIEISYTDIAVEHEKPEHYLNNDYRDGQSTFCLISKEDIESGCKKLREDIASGVVESVIRQFEAKEMKVGGSSIIYGQKLG